jgi:hypothetical protein
MLFSRKGTLILSLTLIEALLGSFLCWTFGFHYAMASDGWPQDVAPAMHLFEGICLVGLGVTVLAVYSILRRDTKQVTWIMIVCALANLVAAYWYIYCVNANSDRKARLRTWFLAAVPSVLWVCAGIPWIQDLAPEESTTVLDESRRGR